MFQQQSTGSNTHVRVSTMTEHQSYIQATTHSPDPFNT